MMYKLICILLSLFLLPSLLSANDAISISKQIGRKTEALFFARNFNEINKLEQEYRTNQCRLPDGRWKLTFLYSYIGAVSKRGAESEWKRQLALVDEWISQTPNQPAPYLAKAEILIAYAWDARGSGWASTVKDEQWILFRGRISEARNILEAKKGIMKDNPYWYLKMIIIAKAQNWPEKAFDALYREAVSVAPAYYHIHFRAADYYQPRWHGSKKKLRRFVNNAVKSTKDLEGMALYTRIYWSQLWALKDKTFTPGYAQWDKMRQGFKDIMRQYPDSKWNLNAYAYYACMANDWPTTHHLTDQIGGQPILSIWDSYSRFDVCRQRASELKRAKMY